jgi:hypothetical protein
MIAPIPCHTIFDIVATLELSNAAIPSHTLGPDVDVVLTCTCENKLSEITLNNVSKNNFSFFIVFVFILIIHKYLNNINKKPPHFCEGFHYLASNHSWYSLLSFTIV